MAFLLALGVALLLTPIAGRIGTRLRLVDRPAHELKIHRAPVPILGGAAVVGSALGAAGLLGSLIGGWLLGAVLLALVVGLVDDLRPLPAWVRAGCQAVAGLFLVAAGLRLEALGPLGAAGVVLAAVASANAVNLLDGQDGLAGGLALMAALGLAALAAGSRIPEAPELGLALAGALAGFLVWNRPPARIFLGNGGAYGLGVLLAALAAMVGGTAGWRGLLAAGTCLGVFAFELAFTVARRVLSGDPLVAGDRLHTYDLLALRTSRNLVTMAFWGVGAAAAGVGLVISRIPVGAGIAAAAVVGSVAAALGLWLWTVAGRGIRRAP